MRTFVLLLLAVAGFLALAVYLADGRARMRRSLATVQRVIDERGTAVQDAPDPVDECLFDIDIPLDEPLVGSHDDLHLTATQRLDLYRQAEDIYHHVSVPVIPGREEN